MPLTRRRFACPHCGWRGERGANATRCPDCGRPLVSRRELAAGGRYRRALLRMAASTEPWSVDDVRAAVADALGVSVAELLRLLEGKEG